MANGAKRGAILVSARPIPRFRILTDLNKRAERMSALLLKDTLREIRTVVEQTPADPLDDALVSAVEAQKSAGRDGLHVDRIVSAALAKSPGAAGLFDGSGEMTKAERRGLTWIAHHLRQIHGAPTGPSGLVDGPEAEDRLKQIMGTFIPFRGGSLQPDRVGAVRLKGKGPEPIERAVSLVETIHFDERIEARAFRDIALGRRPDEDVEMILHPDTPEPEYTVRKGATTVLLALWLGLPALDVKVFEPREVNRAVSTRNVTQQLSEVSRIAAPRFAPWWYIVPPALEPLAELARRMPREQFVAAFEGRAYGDELAPRYAADIVQRAREIVWQRLYAVARIAGSEKEAAKLRADRSPEFRRLTSVFRQRERIAARIEAAGDLIRQELRQAKAISTDLSRELGLPRRGPGVGNAHILWHHARRPEDPIDLQDAVPMDEGVERPPASISTPRHPNRFEFDAAPGVFEGGGFVGEDEGKQQLDPTEADGGRQMVPTRDNPVHGDPHFERQDSGHDFIHQLTIPAEPADAPVETTTSDEVPGPALVVSG